VTAEGLALALDPGSRRIGRNWRTICPAHDDRHASLDVTDAGDSVLLICRSGCAQREVISALRDRGLWRLESPARATRRISAQREIEAALIAGRPDGQHYDRALFRERYLVAALIDNLSQAARELQAKASAGLDFRCEPRDPSLPLGADELREGLEFAIAFGAIAPAGLSESAVKEAIEITVGKSEGAENAA
jgi:hypothetical protein